MNIENLAWEKMHGLIPAIVQDSLDGRVLMQGFMNQDALRLTLETGKVAFWSRSREKLWIKGETSGNTLNLVDIHPDCDGDSLLVRARQEGPTCHLGKDSCYDDDEEGKVMPDIAFLTQLEAVISQRSADRPEGSYTTRLLDDGIKRIAQKVGEEGVETALAAVTRDDEGLAEEAADLVFHLLVLLRIRGLAVEDLLARLAARRR